MGEEATSDNGCIISHTVEKARGFRRLQYANGAKT
jgi:hypothetical protein